MICTLYLPDLEHFPSPSLLRGWAWRDGTALNVVIAPAYCTCSTLTLVGCVGAAAVQRTPTFVQLDSSPAGLRLVALLLNDVLVNVRHTLVLYTVRRSRCYVDLQLSSSAAATTRWLLPFPATSRRCLRPRAALHRGYRAALVLLARTTATWGTGAGCGYSAQ